MNLTLTALSITAAAFHTKKASFTSFSATSTLTSLSARTSPAVSTSLPTSPPCLYLWAHLPAIFSEWLQSPHMFQVNWSLVINFVSGNWKRLSSSWLLFNKQLFQVYKSRGHDDASIALLFLFSSLSSAILGSLVGNIPIYYTKALLVTCFFYLTRQDLKVNLVNSEQHQVSSCDFAPGATADKYGRKKVAQVAGVLPSGFF